MNEHTAKAFDVDLQELGRKVAEMGGLAEKQLVDAVAALTRHDLDLALIPAETINDDGLFLDDERFITVREELPMPVFPSYDFIDVLAHEGEPVLSGRHAA